MGNVPPIPRGNAVTRANGSVRFATFELDLRAGELRKSGVKIKLHGQPFEVLAMLLERPGEVVTREELQQQGLKRRWRWAWLEMRLGRSVASMTRWTRCRLRS